MRQCPEKCWPSDHGCHLQHEVRILKEFAGRVPAKRCRYVKRQDFWRVPHFFRDMEADFEEEEECPLKFQLLGYATLSACIRTLILLDLIFSTILC